MSEQHGQNCPNDVSERHQTIAGELAAHASALRLIRRDDDHAIAFAALVASYAASASEAARAAILRFADTVPDQAQADVVRRAAASIRTAIPARR